MERTEQTCIVCRQTMDSSHLVAFGDDLVCGDCKDEYVQCLREGLVPSFEAGVWKHGRFVVAEPKAVLTDRCVSCNQPATLTRPLKYVPRQQFKLTLKFPKPQELDVGFCEPCRNVLDRYAKLAGVATIFFGVGWLGGTFLSWTNAMAVGYICGILTFVGGFLWLVRLCLKSEPSATYLEKQKLIRIRGTGKAFKSSLPDVPISRLHQYMD